LKNQIENLREESLAKTATMSFDDKGRKEPGLKAQKYGMFLEAINPKASSAMKGFVPSYASNGLTPKYAAEGRSAQGDVEDPMGSWSNDKKKDHYLNKTNEIERQLAELPRGSVYERELKYRLKLNQEQVSRFAETASSGSVPKVGNRSKGLSPKIGFTSVPKINNVNEQFKGMLNTSKKESSGSPVSVGGINIGYNYNESKSRRENDNAMITATLNQVEQELRQTVMRRSEGINV